MEQSIANIVKNHVLQASGGNLFTINDFAYLNHDAVVTRTFSRLHKEGVLVRIATGIYAVPVETKFGLLLPNIDKVARKIADRDKAEIMPTGSTALNILGLSTQVPMNAVYITNGAKRKVRVGNRNIVFKNVVQKNFQFKGKLLPLIIIALKELGEKETTDAILDKITPLLNNSDIQERESMLHDLYLSPMWIKNKLFPIIKPLTE